MEIAKDHSCDIYSWSQLDGCDAIRYNQLFIRIGCVLHLEINRSN